MFKGPPPDRGRFVNKKDFMNTKMHDDVCVMDGRRDRHPWLAQRKGHNRKDH